MQRLVLAVTMFVFSVGSVFASEINLTSGNSTDWVLATVYSGDHGSNYTTDKIREFDYSQYTTWDFSRQVIGLDGGLFNAPFAPVVDGNAHITDEVLGFNFGWGTGNWVTAAQPNLVVTSPSAADIERYASAKVGQIQWVGACDQAFQDALLSGAYPNDFPGIEGYVTTQTTTTVTPIFDFTYNGTTYPSVNGAFQGYVNNLDADLVAAMVADGAVISGTANGGEVWWSKQDVTTTTIPGTTFEQACAMYKAQVTQAYVDDFGSFTFDGFDENGIYAYKTVFDAIEGVYDVSLDSSMMYDDHIVGFILNGVEMTFTSEINNSGVQAWQTPVNVSGLFNGVQMYETGNELIFILANNQQGFYNNSYFMNPTGWAGSIDLSYNGSGTPEPATLVMFGIGICGLGLARRFGRK